MSTEISVLSDSRLRSIVEWQHAIDAEEFPLRLSADARFDERGGALSAHVRDKLTSVQYRIEDAVELIRIHKEINFGHNWKYLITFPWIGDFDELDMAWMIATAYARATSGAVYDPQEGKLFGPEEALQIVREMERTRPQAEAALRNYVEQLSAKSPEAEAALRAFMQRRSRKSDHA